MALWDTLWFSLLNYTSSWNELSPLVTAPPSSAHLLKLTCSNVVAKHCTFLWMLKTWLRGVTLVLLILRGWREIFSDLDSFQQTHWSWQAFVVVVERGRVCENTSICRIPLLLVSTCDYNECATGSSSWTSQLGPDSSTSTALCGRGPTMGYRSPTTCGHQVTAVRAAWVREALTPATPFFFYFFYFLLNPKSENIMTVAKITWTNNFIYYGEMVEYSSSVWRIGGEGFCSAQKQHLHLWSLLK